MNKKPIIVLIVLLLLAAVAYALSKNNTPQEVVVGNSNVSLYADSVTGLEFEYKDTYVLEEKIDSENNIGKVKTVVLTEKSELGERENSEGPATISVSIFKNTANQSASVWAMQNPMYSNMNTAQGSSTETVVGGANAVRYNADGLYMADTVVVAHGGYMFVFSGMYIDAESDLKKDFQPLLNSVVFRERTEPAGQNAKIDIAAVCQGALAYMLFQDGASADAFVQECIEGKHPDVIEKFKADMNLGDGAAI